MAADELHSDQNRPQGLPGDLRLRTPHSTMRLLLTARASHPTDTASHTCKPARTLLIYCLESPDSFPGQLLSLRPGCPASQLQWACPHHNFLFLLLSFASAPGSCSKHTSEQRNGHARGAAPLAHVLHTPALKGVCGSQLSLLPHTGESWRHTGQGSSCPGTRAQTNPCSKLSARPQILQNPCTKSFPEQPGKNCSFEIT